MFVDNEGEPERVSIVVESSLSANPGFPIGLMTGLWIGLGVAWMAVRILAKQRIELAGQEGVRILEEARLEAESLRRHAELEAEQIRLDAQKGAESESRTILDQLCHREHRLELRAKGLDQQADRLTRRADELDAAWRRIETERTAMDRRASALEEAELACRTERLHLAGLDEDQARAEILERFESSMAADLERRRRGFERRWGEDRQRLARELLAAVLPRFAGTEVGQVTSVSLSLPDEKLKARIVGREGRNIRAFERATGCDLIVDEAPQQVLLSSFDGRRREVARMSLQRLLDDGRIDPSRIEEAVAESQAALGERVTELGHEAADRAGVPLESTELLEALGEMQFRTSCAQNLRLHSIEVAILAGLLAEELGLDPDLARHCGLLHDLGKLADPSHPGSHDQAGADWLRRLGQPDPVIAAARDHHQDRRVLDPYTAVVATADALSAARPGARHEAVERRLQRVEQLEAIAYNHPDVEQAFAVRAGRELHVLVDSGTLDDQGTHQLCESLVRTIASRGGGSGEDVRVVVFREVRAMAWAR